MNHDTTQPAVRPTRGQTQPSRMEWLVTFGLILLAVIPVLAGMVRVGQLTIGLDTTPVTPENARFFASPLPVILHPWVDGVCAAGCFPIRAEFSSTLSTMAPARRLVTCPSRSSRCYLSQPV